MFHACISLSVGNSVCFKVIRFGQLHKSKAYFQYENVPPDLYLKPWVISFTERLKKEIEMFKASISCIAHKAYDLYFPM